MLLFFISFSSFKVEINFEYFSTINKISSFLTETLRELNLCSASLSKLLDKFTFKDKLIFFPPEEFEKEVKLLREKFGNNNQLKMFDEKI